MSSLKDSWKQVGKEIGSVGKDLGKTIVKTVKTGAKAVTDWADEEEEKKADAPEADVVIEPEQKEE